MGKMIGTENMLTGTDAINFLTNTKRVLDGNKSDTPIKICSSGMGASSDSWTEKYRARTLDELIVPDAVKNAGARILKTGRLQNLLLHGSYGIGKTSFAGIIIDTLGFQALFPKNRLQNSLRDVYSLSSKTSVFGSRFCALLDEFDHCQLPVQKEILTFLEGTGTPVKCSVLIANETSKLHNGIISRCKELSFDWSEKEQPKLTEQLRSRLIYILNNEKVRFLEKDVDDYIEEYFIGFWDIRKLINEIEGAVDAENNLLPCE